MNVLPKETFWHGNPCELFYSGGVPADFFLRFHFLHVDLGSPKQFIEGREILKWPYHYKQRIANYEVLLH